jgi:heme a synthase
MGRHSTVYRWALGTGALLAFLVVVLGAVVRLSDAGLSCPDWPGCFGYLRVSDALANHREVAARWPDRPLHPGRAGLEMLHRYAAGLLGLLILAVAASAWRHGGGRVAATLLLGLLVIQALLGMWTVTLGLKPTIVVAHLIGGLCVLAVLWWLVLDGLTAADRRLAPGPAPGPRWLRSLALVGLGLLAVQIALGGWTSANQAGLVCQGFPTCNGAWWPAVDLAAGFDPAGDRPPDWAGLVAIHWAHRLGALTVLAVLGTLALASAWVVPRVRGLGLALGALLAVQVGLGIGTVLAGAPLPLAAAHHAVAALLLLALLTLNHRLAWGGPIPGETS